MSSPNEWVLDESRLPERVVEDVRRALLQRRLIIGEATTRKFNGGEIHRGRAIVRGLDCEIDVYLADDQSLLVLCAKPDTSWVFGDCFPEIPDATSINDFFLGRPPEEFKQPLLSRIGLDDSIWMLISAADEELIQASAAGILANLNTWPKNGIDTGQLVAGINIFGKPLFGDSDTLRGDDLLKSILPEKWDQTVQAIVEFNSGAPVLSVPIALLSNELDLGAACKLSELTVRLSTPMYYVRRAPDVRLKATLELGSERFALTADYPLDDEIVEARLEVETGKRPPFLGDTSGLPDLTSPGMELVVGVSLSKSELTLKKAYLDLELNQSWKIVEGILEIGNPEFHFLVLDPVGETRLVTARVAGELIVAESTLRVSGNYAASKHHSSGQFAVALDPKTPLNLTGLIGHLLGKDAGDISPPLPDCTIDTLLFECDLSGHIFMETSVSVSWGIAITSGVTLEFKQLRFLFETWGKSTRFRAGADLELGGLSFNLTGDYNSASGWSFQGGSPPGAKINIGEFTQKLAKELGAGRSAPAALADLSFQDVELTLDTKTSHFEFAITTTFPVGEKALDAIVTIVKAGDSLKFGGKIVFGGAQFTLDFEASPAEKQLQATWEKLDHQPGLDLSALSDQGIAGLEDFGTLLRPNRAELTLSLDESETSLTLNCDLEQGAAAVRIAKQDDRWVAAIGFTAPKVSTESLGPLGSALKPHNIALDKLAIVAASADAGAGNPLTLAGQEYVVTKGLLLQGALEFESTSFSFPFECRLGGGEPSEKLTEEDADETAPQAAAPGLASSGAAPGPAEGQDDLVEGNNNVSVGRTIGPVTFRQARLASRNQRVYVMLDASIGSGCFELDLTGFNVNFPLTLLQDPVEHAGEIAVGLDGLSISYTKPPLTISGGFARTEAVKPYVDDLYRGFLLIKAETFQVTVLGSYGNILVDGEKQPSLFLYGTYAGAIGGPPPFFVLGLSLGGGFNTRLVLPPVEKVAEFPLVQAVTDPDNFANGAADRLQSVVQPSYGDYWLAMGVRFTSFKMADSFALFSVSFGTRLQFALLGLTKLTMPVGESANNCVVYAELAIRATLDPEAGILAIEGRLTNNSRILAKEFRLKGGFAFFMWFGNAKESGDFVISLGGYHPKFRRPPHYPVVPRVGISGKLSKALSVTGDAYVAITPSCLMAGAKLQAVFRSGRITATFVAYADFIVAWAPFHYDAKIGIGISVAVRLWRTYKVELRAKLHLWGPPLAGTASVSWWVVSFTVAFGSGKQAKPAKLSWNQFEESFLPPSSDSAGHALLGTIRIADGLVREVKVREEGDEVTYRIVNPHELMIETDSAVPCSEVRVGSENDAQKNNYAQAIGIRPMGATELTSLHAVEIKKDSTPVQSNAFQAVQWSKKNYPEALWSAKGASGKPEAGMVKDVPSGVVLRVQPRTPEHALGPIAIKILKYEPIPKQIPWSTATPVPGMIEQEDFPGVLKDNPLRSQIRDCLVKRFAHPEESSWNEIDMANTSASPGDHFQAPPTCAVLGQSL